MQKRFAIAVVAGLVVLPGSAFSDIPPPQDYVETCTIDHQRQEGETCRECSASHMNPGYCETSFADSGLDRRCRTWGASAWTEVWCGSEFREGTGLGPATDPVTEDPVVPEEGARAPVEVLHADVGPKCGMSATSGNAVGAGLCGMIVAGVLIGMRRSRKDK